MSKKRGKKMIIIILLIFIVYYIYVLAVTNKIMETAKSVAAGDIVVESGTPYARFSPWKENVRTDNIKRYFAYCGINKGKIYVTCVDIVEHDDGKVNRGRDWFVILIERTDKGWVAVRTFGKA